MRLSPRSQEILLAVLVVVFFLPSGLAAAPPPSGPPPSTSLPELDNNRIIFMWGEIDFDRCTQEESVKIQSAMHELRSRIHPTQGGENYLACLRDSWAARNQDWMPEEIYVNSNTTRHLEISCVDLDEGVAGQSFGSAEGEDTEELELDSAWVRSDATTLADIAGVIVHEVLHQNGARHPEDNNTPSEAGLMVNTVGQSCVSNGSPTVGSRRSAMTGKIPLSRVGASAGSGVRESDLSCSDQYAGIGLDVQFDDYGLKNIGLRCGDINDPSRETVESLFIGPTEFMLETQSYSCTNESILTGIYGSFEQRFTGFAQLSPVIRSIGMACTRLGDLGNPRPWGSEWSAWGWDEGLAFDRFCAPGTVLMGLKGQSDGSRVIGFNPICRPVGEVGLRSRARTSRGEVIGGSGGGASRLDCPGNTVATGVAGRAASLIDRLLLKCNEQSIRFPTEFTGKYAFSDAAGGDGGKGFILDCDPREVIVGFNGRSGANVDQIRPLCASAERWIRGEDWSAHETEFLTVGGTGGTPFSTICPAKEAIVGLDVRSGSLIDSIHLICAHVDPYPEWTRPQQ
jgi:hypothetical protein